MTTFNKQELLNIAKLSALKLNEQEIDLYMGQIQSILSYVDQLQAVPITSDQTNVRNSNIFREDIAIQKDNTLVLQQAPEVDEGYFTVPKILDEK